MKSKLHISLFLIGLLFGCHQQAQIDLQQLFTHPPQSAKPWLFWYWVNAAISEEGITADLEAMKENGIGGAYLCFVLGPTDPPLYTPVAEQLSTEWWKMVDHAFKEAERIGMELAIHSCDGFTVAGGPWITPDKSMQKIVWSKLNVSGGQTFNDTLPQPETLENYYKDLAVFAFPTPVESRYNSNSIEPYVTTNATKEDISFISKSTNEKEFKSYEPCWIQYEFDEPFTCRSIHIRTHNLNYASYRLIVESSDDGVNFNRICRLEPPRHGWQDFEADITHAIPKTTAKFFRFRYITENFEPAAEDMETAKWSSALKIQGITLSGESIIHQYEGKNGSIWRVGKKTTSAQLPDSACIARDQLLDISSNLDSAGVLHWQIPPGGWTILRMGHTSTGHTNYIGGGGKGLECDKFDQEVVKFQFEQWFGKIYSHNSSAPNVLKQLYVDSWECGSQNWSPVFATEFEKRRGYKLGPFLPVMAGIPIESADFSERVLHDIRVTISDLIEKNFFGTLKELAHAKSCEFSAENIAPVMHGDGMLHFQHVDYPMGEFWLNSPTHDKPNDLLDAISGAHIYGKNIVQAESFTTLRMDWSEHPGMLKPLADKYFSLGINRMAMHVYTLNPWIDRKPGMTLNGVGLYFQRDQTWWEDSKEWVSYLERCQILLQQGNPVVDIAVFTGEEIPRRALTPDRLIEVLPGLFSDELLEIEKIRQANIGVPMHKIPRSVSSTKNTFSLNNWIDPLRGYQYDCINGDALLRLAKVEEGRIVLPGGASYGVLVIPGKQKMDPNYQMSIEIADKIRSLLNEGATVIFNDYPEETPGIPLNSGNQQKLQAILSKLLEGEFQSINEKNALIAIKEIGKGRLIRGPYKLPSFDILNLNRDFIARESEGNELHNISWTHRKGKSFDIYFLSNQSSESIEFTASLRLTGRIPEIFDPLSGEVSFTKNWYAETGRTEIPLRLEPNGAVFIVLRKSTKETSNNSGSNWVKPLSLQSIEGPWMVKFDTAYGGPVQSIEFSDLKDWTESPNDRIKYYSGTAVYNNTFKIEAYPNEYERMWLDLGRVENIAEVVLNGKNCGSAWTFPYWVDISDAIQQGPNNLIIKLTNTWHNRLIGDNELPVEDRTTWTNAPFRLEGEPLLTAGLIGPVRIVVDKEKKY